MSTPDRDRERLQRAAARAGWHGGLTRLEEQQPPEPPSGLVDRLVALRELSEQAWRLSGVAAVRVARGELCGRVVRP